jgi:hypothetical protein
MWLHRGIWAEIDSAPTVVLFITIIPTEGKSGEEGQSA